MGKRDSKSDDLLSRAAWKVLFERGLNRGMLYFVGKIIAMAHSFTITLVHNIPSVLKHVESVITGSGGMFRGDAEKGNFQGQTVAGLIKGEYCALSENEIRITITGKPFIVPYGMIEAEIRKYFG